MGKDVIVPEATVICSGDLGDTRIGPPTLLQSPWGIYSSPQVIGDTLLTGDVNSVTHQICPVFRLCQKMFPGGEGLLTFWDMAEVEK